MLPGAWRDESHVAQAGEGRAVVSDDMGSSIVIAVDAEKHPRDAAALGCLLADALGVPAVLTEIFPTRLTTRAAQS